MRGHKSGLETRTRDFTPPLINIDGNTCHHVHNIVKTFTGSFENYIENMFCQIYTEFNTSADSMEMLKDIAYHLGLTFRKQVNYVATRWTSILDTSLSFSYIEFANVLYYQAILSKITEDGIKKVYKKLKKGGNDDSADKEQRKLERRKKYIMECDKQILAVISLESIKAIRLIQKMLAKST